jgi:hypothetical protein
MSTKNKTKKGSVQPMQDDRDSLNEAATSKSIKSISDIISKTPINHQMQKERKKIRNQQLE